MKTFGGPKTQKVPKWGPPRILHSSFFILHSSFFILHLMKNEEWRMKNGILHSSLNEEFVNGDEASEGGTLIKPMENKVRWGDGPLWRPLAPRCPWALRLPISSFFILPFFILHSPFFILHSSFFILHSSFFIKWRMKNEEWRIWGGSKMRDSAIPVPEKTWKSIG